MTNQNRPYFPTVGAIDEEYLMSLPLSLPFANNQNIPNFPNFNPADPSTFVQPGTSSTQQGTGFKWLGKDGVLIPGLSALSNLASAYTGYKQLGLAEDAFNFNKALTLSNLANQATITNQAIEDRIRSGAINRGVPVPDVDKLVASQMENRRIKGTL